MKFEAPIAGANLVADTRNYPWRRPPDIVDYDEAVDYMLNTLTDDAKAELVYSLLQIETSVVTVTSALLMQAVAKGKIPIDLAILIAGPVARYIQIIADSEGFKYEMGAEENRPRITPTLLKMSMGIIEMEEEEPKVEDMPKGLPMGGIMGAPSLEDTEAASEDEQAAMLGMLEEEEDTNGMA